MQVSAASSSSPPNNLMSLSLPLTSSLRLLCVVISNRCWADALSVELGRQHLYFLRMLLYNLLIVSSTALSYRIMSALPCLVLSLLFLSHLHLNHSNHSSHIDHINHHCRHVVIALVYPFSMSHYVLLRHVLSHILISPSLLPTTFKLHIKVN